MSHQESKPDLLIPLGGSRIRICGLKGRYPVQLDDEESYMLCEHDAA